MRRVVWNGSALLSPTLAMLYLVTLPIYCLLHVTNQTRALGPATACTVVLLFGVSAAHLVETRGIRRAFAMVAIAFTITLGFELVGVATGLVYGSYSYTDQLGPKVLGLVPIVVPVAWLMMLYPAYETATIVLPNMTGAVVQPVRAVVAAFAMTAWDLSLDPRMVRDGNWFWNNGGAYFGIPLSNFAGWLLTACVIYALWQVIDSRNSRQQPWATLPVYMYIVTWLAESCANILVWGSPLVGVMVFAGMGVFSLPALLYLRDRHVEIWLSATQTVRQWF
jgi:uncharacterized membrane protein